jgi:ADP-heptose:LPS heptosyltransferase
MKSLLVIQPFSFSEIVHGLQVVQSLAWARPDCRITWVVSEEFAELVQASPYVRETIVYSQRAGWGEFFSLRRKLEIKMFDAVWDMAGVLRSGLLTSAVKSLEKWGRTDARQFSGHSYHKRITPPNGPGPHQALDILSPFLRAAGVPLRLYFPMELKPAGKAYPWEEFFSGDPRNTFVVFPDNRTKAETWPYYSELSAFILEKIPDSRIVWYAFEKTQPVCVMPAPRFLNITGCPLAEMLALARQPATFVGNESGPMHLSAALGNPVLALFGLSDSREAGPYPLDAAKHHTVSAPDRQLAKLQPAAVLAALEELRQRSL